MVFRPQSITMSRSSSGREVLMAEAVQFRLPADITPTVGFRSWIWRPRS
jgi:hypothetical protein